MRRWKGGNSSTETEKISTERMNLIFERLKSQQNRKSTQRNYHCIWKKFISFTLNLDEIPMSWEERLCLFGTHMVEKGSQSTTIRSYMSALKFILRTDDIELNEEKIRLGIIIKACKVQNDRLYVRFPIRLSLLEQMLFEIECLYGAAENNQPYLELMYKSLLLASYYGLLCIGEVTAGDHVIKAGDLHVGTNKNKMLIVLFTSKTHGVESRPQKVHITENGRTNKFFCPFKTLKAYSEVRGDYIYDNEQFFVFVDHSPVYPHHAHNLVHTLLSRLNLDTSLYSFHSLRIGMASDMLRRGYTVEQIRLAGRWKTNAVFKYLRD